METLKPPPFLLGAVTLFWAWHNECLLFGLLMALIVEGAAYLSFRWELTVKDFQRVADVCSLMFLGTIIYNYMAFDLLRGSFFPLRWLPVSLFPLLVAQVYDVKDTVDGRALFWLLRRKQRETEEKIILKMNVSYPYAAICLFAAGATNMRTSWFYAGVLGGCGWTFWTLRSRRYSLLTWAALLVLAAGIGYWGHTRLYQLQQHLENSAALLEWLGFLRRDMDPYHSSTAIGEIGSVKIGNEVVARVKALSGAPSSLLLREASYPLYKSAGWFVLNDDFSRVFPEADESTWNLQPPADGAEQVAVSMYMTRGKAVLKVPLGLIQTSRLLVGNMDINPYGAIKVEEGPGLLTYQTQFHSAHPLDSPPDEGDVELPPDEEEVFRQLVEELGLRSMSDEQALRVVQTFFQNNFSYSLDLVGEQNSKTPLTDFLRATRSGHCEYFATTTVLLLRAAGIPARYAVGYAVEDLRKDRWTIVRGRDAHAWTLVYLNGVWRDFDTTPPSWRNFEDDLASSFEALANFWAKITFALSEWRWGFGKGGNEPYLIGIMVVLLSILGWRFYTRRRKIPKRLADIPELDRVFARPGLDSAFYQIEQKLQQEGLTRYDWEPFSHWLARLETQESSFPAQGLRPILELHYRYRFDPLGLSGEELLSLQTAAQTWLAQRKKSSPE